MDAHLQLILDTHTNASLMITYDSLSVPMVLDIRAASNSSLKVMLKNESKEAVNLQVRGKIARDAQVTLALCELNEADMQADIVMELLEEGAYADIRSACIANASKHYEVNCIHHKPHTTGLMEHYAVVEESGRYAMKACGTIEKGAYGSASHQKTRVLTMSEQHTSEVTPLLLIDENDVKASHATTLGQPDENQLYYLQTRGLSRKQALGLLTVGYIMPITELFEDETVNQKLKNEIEMKVGLHA